MRQIQENEILVTGANGLLGKTIRRLMPESVYTDIDTLNILDYQALEKFVINTKIRAVFHIAAFTSPPLIDKDPIKALDVNIVGTANIVKLCSKHGLRVIYVCTDYVFKGDKGNYTEDDPVFPVNKYAWSKLGGECAVRMYDDSLIMRTTFGPDVFPYEKAFVDQWTSRESVSVIAKKMVKLIKSGATGVVHVGGQRRTVYDYAKSLDPSKNIKELKTTEINFKVPKDTSLNCEKYDKILKGGY